MAALALVVALACVVVAGIVIYLRFRAERELAAEKERRAKLLIGNSKLRHLEDLWARATGSGEIAMLAVGTLGARELARVLRSMMHAGVGDRVGSILVVEFDEVERQMCVRAIPEPFLDRVIECGCALLPGGINGEPIERALQSQPLWGSNVAAATAHWLSQLQRESKPGLLLTFLSPGGMAATGLPVLQAFNKRYPRNPIYAVTILDHKQVVRQRFPTFRRYYTQSGLIRGMIVLDNRRQSERHDVGIAALCAGLTNSAWVGKLPLQPQNALGYTFPSENPGGLATISTWAETLPVYHLPAWGPLPELWYTTADLVKEKIIRATQELLENLELQSLPLPAAKNERLRSIYVIAPIIPDPDLRDIAQWAEQALEKWIAENAPGVLVHFASVSLPLNAVSQEIPLIVVALQPVEDDGTQIDQLAFGTLEIDPGFNATPLALPKPVSTPTAAEPVGAVGTTGMANDAEFPPPGAAPVSPEAGVVAYTANAAGAPKEVA
ncbi:MAG TPA: hypothetical protein VF952_00775 [Chloroflexia bacterium]